MILGESNYSLIEEDTPMTLSDTAAAQLWESFPAGGGANLVREAVELVLQELIEVEAAEAIGAGRYERSDARAAERDGHRPRLLATCVPTDIESEGGSEATMRAAEAGSGLRPTVFG